MQYESKNRGEVEMILIILQMCLTLGDGNKRIDSKRKVNVCGWDEFMMIVI